MNRREQILARRIGKLDAEMAQVASDINFHAQKLVEHMDTEMVFCGISDIDVLAKLAEQYSALRATRDTLNTVNEELSLSETMA